MITQNSKTGLYLEDLAVGAQFRSGSYTMTEDEIKQFARQYDPQVFHLDDAGARDTLFGGLAASGWHTAAVAMRLLVEGGLPIAGGLIGAGTELRWPRPVRPGDTLTVQTTVLEITPSRSKPDRGIVLCQSDTLNQNGEVVQQSRAKVMVLRKPKTA
ncbi:MAG TPA: MaoC family dehydratase [Bordetella sp.]|uniref:MaoC family dehydratase n=1 Tax=Bordetella sp. TaxID=28081 RepID=UPI002ED4C496